MARAKTACGGCGEVRTTWRRRGYCRACYCRQGKRRRRPVDTMRASRPPTVPIQGPLVVIVLGNKRAWSASEQRLEELARRARQGEALTGPARG